MSIEYVKQDQLIFWHLKVEIEESGCKGSFPELRGHLPARRGAESPPQSRPFMLAVALQMHEVWEKWNENIPFPESTVCQDWDSNPGIGDP